MLKSDELSELAAALCAFQAEVDAIPKTAKNPFFKSRYAPLPEVVAVAGPIAAKHGLSVTQFPMTTEGNVDCLLTILMHTSGQFLAETTQLHLVKRDPQAHGSAITYMRRYAYMGVLGLVADEDDDGNKASGNDAPKARRARKPVVSEEPPVEDSGPITEEQVKRLNAALPKLPGDAKERNRTLRTALQKVGVEGATTDDLVKIKQRLSAEQTDWLLLKLERIVELGEAADAPA